ncbi:MAG: hypothetical protein Q8M79_12715 [Dehalococcoidia bacterium]|nr:hypothetical protein [Dehalococcoidia bacterium]
MKWQARHLNHHAPVAPEPKAPKAGWPAANSPAPAEPAAPPAGSPGVDAATGNAGTDSAGQDGAGPENPTAVIEDAGGNASTGDNDSTSASTGDTGNSGNGNAAGNSGSGNSGSGNTANSNAGNGNAGNGNAGNTSTTVPPGMSVVTWMPPGLARKVDGGPPPGLAGPEEGVLPAGLADRLTDNFGLPPGLQQIRERRSVTLSREQSTLAPRENPRAALRLQMHRAAARYAAMSVSTQFATTQNERAINAARSGPMQLFFGWLRIK